MREIDSWTSFLVKTFILWVFSAFLFSIIPDTNPAFASGDESTTKSDVDEDESSENEDSSGEDSTKSKASIQLEGRASVRHLHPGNPRQASINYRKACAALAKKNYKAAANLFSLTADQFGKGFEGYRADAKYAEAQCRRLLGQKVQATKLYGQAIDLFKQYKPDSPYLKASIDQHGNINPLKMQVPKMARVIRGAVVVDDKITLKGKITDGGKRLRGQDAVMDVDKKFIDDSIHQCFIDMTCLETAEIGSNSSNAKNRFVPLKAYGKTAVVSAADDAFFCPIIKVKINGKYYEIHVNLPGLTNSQRTVLLVTDGANICAIDVANTDVWLLKMDLKKKKHSKARKGTFKWKKLEHQKGHIRHETVKVRKHKKLQQKNAQARKNSKKVYSRKKARSKKKR